MQQATIKDTNPKDLVGQTKANIFLVPPASIIAEAEALMDGAKKYDPYNWRTKGVRASVYISAAIRHLMSYQDGEEVASDSKVHHLGHAKACLGILLDAIAQGNIVDDRPVKGNAPKLLAEVYAKNETALVPEAAQASFSFTHGDAVRIYDRTVRDRPRVDLNSIVVD